MSLEELRKLGSLMDEEQWNGERHRTVVPLGRFLSSVVIGIAGCAAIGLGDGGRLTWAGVVALLIGLFTFMGVSVRAIDVDDGEASDHPSIANPLQRRDAARRRALV